jgi:hypothetical protein
MNVLNLKLHKVLIQKSKFNCELWGVFLYSFGIRHRCIHLINILFHYAFHGVDLSENWIRAIELNLHLMKIHIQELEYNLLITPSPQTTNIKSIISILSFHMFKKEVELGVFYTSIFATTFHKMVISSFTSIYSNQNLVKGHLWC